jgi:uncharacterized protein (DUF697 family)
MKMSKKGKINIPTDQKIKCNAIIHSASVSAGAAGTGLAQIPLADSAVITPIQIGMIVALGKIFDQEISKSAAKAILAGMASAFAGRGISQVLVGWIPGVGNAVNAATAATITEAVGWMAVDSFSKDAYKDIIAQNPMTDDERKENAKEEAEKKQNEREELISRANVFIQGEKNKKSNIEEYNQLLNEFDIFLLDIDQSDSINEIYKSLLDLK